MKERFLMEEVQPEAYAAMMAWKNTSTQPASIRSTRIDQGKGIAAQRLCL